MQNFWQNASVSNLNIEILLLNTNKVLAYTGYKLINNILN